MSHEKSIEPHNDKGQQHGYQKIYDSYGTLWREGLFINGKRHGYWKWYSISGVIRYKYYYI